MAGVWHQRVKTSSYNGYFLLMICMFTVVHLIAAQGSSDYHDYINSNPSSSYGVHGGRLPCVHRGTIVLHGESLGLDECTRCHCDNSSVTCSIKSCPPTFCDVPISFEEQCCDICPFYVPIHELSIDATNANTSEIGLNGLTLRMKINEEGQTVHGERLWRVGMWLSDGEDGLTERYHYVHQVLKEGQESAPLRRPPIFGGFNLTIDNIEYLFPSDSHIYHTHLCAEFAKGQSPHLTHPTVPFDVVGVESELSSNSDPTKLVTCVERTNGKSEFEVVVVDANHGYLTYAWSALSNTAPPGDHKNGYTYTLSNGDDIIIKEGVINETTITIYGLQCDTTYVFNVVSNTTSPWIPSTVATRTGIPAVNQIESRVMSESILYFAWRATEPCNPDFLPEYKYRLYNRNSSRAVSSGVVSGPDVTISALDCNTVYTFIVATSSPMANSSWSDQVVARTQSRVPASATNLKILQTENSTSQITWSVPRGCLPRVYLIKVKLISQCGESWLSPVYLNNEPESGSRTFNLSNILPSHTYTAYVTPINDVGMGTTSDVSMTTDDTVPSEAPSSVNQDKMTPNRLRFTWNDVPCANRNGLIQRYVYEFDTIESDETGETERKEITITPSRHFNISTEYRFRVAAATSAGSGPWTPWAHGTIRVARAGDNDVESHTHVGSTVAIVLLTCTLILLIVVILALVWRSRRQSVMNYSDMTLLRGKDENTAYGDEDTL